MPRTSLIVVLALASLLGACVGAPSVHVATDGARAIDPPAVVAPDPDVVPFAVRSAERIRARDVEGSRGIPGVVAVGRAAFGALDLRAVTGATRSLPRAQGRHLAVSVAALDPAPLARTASLAGVAETLARGHGALTTTSAGLRGMDPGDRMRLSGEGRTLEVEIGSILSENGLFQHEIVLPLDRARHLGVRRTRALIVAIRRDAIPAATEALARAFRPARIVRLDVPSGDASLLPLAKVKEMFGEFSYRRARAGRIIPDPDWVRSFIIDYRVPVLGWVRCHRAIVGQLAWAMYEIHQAGLATEIESYDGCFVPRMQRGETEILSRHAFGIAIDLNAASNELGDPPSLDPRVVQIMERWGFAWGGRWLVPDGMHFEAVRLVRPRG